MDMYNSKYHRMGMFNYRQHFNDMSDTALQLMIQYSDGIDSDLPFGYSDDGTTLEFVSPAVCEMCRRMAYKVVEDRTNIPANELLTKYDGKDWFVREMRLWFSDIVAVCLDIYNLEYNAQQLFAVAVEHDYTDEDQFTIDMTLQYFGLQFVNYCFTKYPVYYTPSRLMADPTEVHDFMVYLQIFKTLAAGELLGLLPKEMLWLLHKIYTVCNTVSEVYYNEVCDVHQIDYILHCQAQVRKWYNEISRWIGGQVR